MPGSGFWLHRRAHKPSPEPCPYPILLAHADILGLVTAPWAGNSGQGGRGGASTWHVARPTGLEWRHATGELGELPRRALDSTNEKTPLEGGVMARLAERRGYNYHGSSASPVKLGILCLSLDTQNPLYNVVS